mmetsp:Transcript_7791/g.19359  ORF Transcript_7791/g.19359 Transcript_7791/m.19359 type:complete len:253 (-) Transcript_7791:3354-4112(-)
MYRRGRGTQKVAGAHRVMIHGRAGYGQQRHGTTPNSTTQHTKLYQIHRESPDQSSKLSWIAQNRQPMPIPTPTNITDLHDGQHRPMHPYHPPPPAPAHPRAHGVGRSGPRRSHQAQLRGRLLLRLAPAPQPVVQPLVEVGRHVLDVGQVGVLQQVQLLVHVVLAQVRQLAHHLDHARVKVLPLHVHAARHHLLQPLVHAQRQLLQHGLAGHGHAGRAHRGGGRGDGSAVVAARRQVVVLDNVVDVSGQVLDA